MDAIFSSYEVLSRLTRDGSMAYFCYFDLQKAFDTVQYPLHPTSKHQAPPPAIYSAI